MERGGDGESAGRPRRGRPLDEPHPGRLPVDHPARAEILRLHRQALDAGEAGYSDPCTGLFVFTARYLAERRSCCESNCRHCPYLA